jgi:hypothetical protein
MRQRLTLAGHDADALIGETTLSPLETGPSPSTAFARARALKEGLENQAQVRRN